MDCHLVNTNVSICCAGIDYVNSMKKEHNLVFDLVSSIALLQVQMVPEVSAHLYKMISYVDGNNMCFI